MPEHDFDQVVVGSGFGGAASVLRLSEKGYRVLVLEQGRRWRDEDFPKTSWNLRRFLWLPALGLRGTWRVTFTRKLIALHGVGVGGGSLIYANTHLIPADEVFQSPSWARIRPDWKATLMPFYGLALRMLGVARNPYENRADHALRKVAERMGRGETYRAVNSGVLFPSGKPGEPVPDPYFAGDGPPRATCRFVGGCMTGCRYNAKNTLVKNYLYFAERNGVEIRPESRVVRIEPLLDARGGRDGSAGYELTVERSTALFLKRRYRVRTQGVVLSGGVLGTVPLLLKAKHLHKTLPELSDRLGEQVRTNSETFLTAGFPNQNDGHDPVWQGTAITSMFSPDAETNVEPVRFSKGSDLAFAVAAPVPLTDAGGRLPRPLQLLVNVLLHPLRTLRLLNPVGKAEKTVFLMVMQRKESFVHLRLRRQWYALFRRRWGMIQEAGDAPLATYFPIGHETARRYAEETGGKVGNVLYDILLGTPVTAHIMGGSAMGRDASEGVVDQYGNVFGYRNLRVLDGSIIPGNLGVNPALTILALTEHALSQVPVGDRQRAGRIKPIRFSKPLPGQVTLPDGAGGLLESVQRYL